jgi:hypothetical protein
LKALDFEHLIPVLENGRYVAAVLQITLNSCNDFPFPKGPREFRSFDVGCCNELGGEVFPFLFAYVEFLLDGVLVCTGTKPSDNR